MRTTFPAYYRPSEELLRELWQKATIVLDANVLLNLYGYPIQARNDLLSVLRRVSARLFVPYQAALEYQRQRLHVIALQSRRFDEVGKVLTDAQNQLQGEFGKLQLAKRHASINPDRLLKDVERAFDSFRGDLDDIETKHAAVSDEDDIRNALDEILDGKIGPTPEQKDLDATYTEGKRRYEENCPPGYLDASKAKSSDSVYTSNGLRIERQYGDLLVWKQIVTTAAERQIKDLIFVTDDEKEDWWWVVESKGKKTIGPRPELIEEIQRDAGVSTFYMYSSERFIQYAKDYLGIAVNPESIEQIRDASQDKKTIRQLGAEIAVLEWLARIHAQNRLEEPGGFPEFVVTLPDGSRLGYEVMLLPLQKSIIEELSQRRPADLKRLYVVQVSDRTPLGFVDDYLALPAGVSVVLGHLEYPSGESNPVFVPDREFPPVPGVSPPAG